MRRRASDAGFTLSELMIVLVIMGVLAAMGGPRLMRDRNEDAGAEFASAIARDMQRSRMEAVSDRRPIRVFFHDDRVEIRRFKPGATPSARFLAPGLTGDDSFRLRTIRPRPGIIIRDVIPLSAAPATPSFGTAPSAANPKCVDLGTLGNATYMGAPVWPPPSPNANADRNIYIYIENTKLPAAHAERRMRVDVQFLTGFVQMRSGW